MRKAGLLCIIAILCLPGLVPGASAQPAVVGEASAYGVVQNGEYANQPFSIVVKGTYSAYGPATLIRAEVTLAIGNERFVGIVDEASPSFCCGNGQIVTVGGVVEFIVHGKVRHATANPPHEHLFGASATTDGLMGFNLMDQSGTAVTPAVPPHNPGVGLVSGVPAVVRVGPPGIGTWTATGPMQAERRDHTATLLANGNVLLIGGTSPGAELYDPATGTFTPTVPPVFDHGQQASATRLADGRVLIAGGNYAPTSAEIYDPATGAFTQVGWMNHPHQAHTATMLLNGQVLVAGGGYGRPVRTTGVAELYDPTTGVFTETGGLNLHRFSHVAALLPNGLVLIAAGETVDTPGYATSTRTAELYDPDTGTFTYTGNLVHPRGGLWWSSAPVLPDGKVLILGGLGNESQTAELYDPTSGTFAETGGLLAYRRAPVATQLPDGRVLVTGGYLPLPVPVVASAAEVYDPATGGFSLAASMLEGRLQHVATLLADGRVLATGGYGNGSADLRSAEIYRVTILPVAKAKDVVVSAAGSCPVAVSPSDVDDGSYDPEGGALTLSLDPEGPFGPGTHSVSLVATSGTGGVSSASAAVTIVDTVPPTLSLVGGNPMTVEYLAVFTDPGAAASDGCAGDLSPAIRVTGAVDTAVLGTHILTYTVSDGSHTVSATRTVVVADTIPPAITCPLDIGVTAAVGASTAPVSYVVPAATDNYPGQVPVTCTRVSGLAFPLGTTTVTCTAVDVSSNRASCGFLVTVATPPVVLETQGVTVQLAYRDRFSTEPPVLPSATGAAYWIEGRLIQARRPLYDLGKIQDTASKVPVEPGSYTLELCYAPGTVGGLGSPDVPMRVSVPPFRVAAGQMTAVTADISQATGILQGSVAINGAAPGTGLSVCVKATSSQTQHRLEYLWCQAVPETGEFRLLLPIGSGTGAVCSTDLVTASGCYDPGNANDKRIVGPGPDGLFQSFDYQVRPAETSPVTWLSGR